jgi:hypothetical protein
MGHLNGVIGPGGPLLDVTVMATHQRVASLKARGMAIPEPFTARALVDTGASRSAVDRAAVARLGLLPTGVLEILSSTSGRDAVAVNEYDLSLGITWASGACTVFTVAAAEADIAFNGFLVLLGWDGLSQCTLNCNGPKGRFSLKY